MSVLTKFVYSCLLICSLNETILTVFYKILNKYIILCLDRDHHVMYIPMVVFGASPLTLDFVSNNIQILRINFIS